MRAVTFAEYGDSSVLQVSEVPEPHAGPGQVRIAVRASGVNPVDWKIRAGYLKDAFPVTLPSIPGLEAAGTVDEVGEGVQHLAVGDEVLGLGSATAAGFAVLDHATAKSPTLSWEEAAAVPMAAETALRCLELLGIAAGQTLLVEGAGGGVGTAAAQFAFAQGLTVVGTASEANHERLRALGVVPTTYGPGLADRVAQLAPQGVDVVLDTAGAGSLAELVAIAGSPDRVVTIADFTAAEHGVRLSSQASAFDALERAVDLSAQGRFAVAIDSTYPFSEAAAAHERSQGGHVSGKVVLVAPHA